MGAVLRNKVPLFLSLTLLFLTGLGISAGCKFPGNPLQVKQLTSQSPAVTVNKGKSELASDMLVRSNQNIVIAFLKEYHHLPACYITKHQALERGWKPQEGNLCEVLPGKVIGGDYFGNREKRLPTKAGRKYYEADINYDCGRRNAERLIYSNDDLMFITKDHYHSFQKQL